VPFIEAESVLLSDTRLKANNIDQMVRIEEDAPAMNAGSFTASSDII
jgi:hypothetical protein